MFVCILAAYSPWSFNVETVIAFQDNINVLLSWHNFVLLLRLLAFHASVWSGSFGNSSGFMSIHKNLRDIIGNWMSFSNFFDFFLIFLRGELDVYLRGVCSFSLHSCLYPCIALNLKNKEQMRKEELWYIPLVYSCACFQNNWGILYVSLYAF